MKSLLIILIFFFSVTTTLAQKKYTQEYLESLSQVELDSCINKALKNQKTGKTLTFVGVGILGASFATSVIFIDQLELGAVLVMFFGGIAGLGTMAVGIPVNVNGKKRIERI